MSQRIPLQEQAVTFRELATLVGAGISLNQSLHDQGRRPLSRSMARFMEDAARKTGEGEKLSAVMKQYPGAFSEITVALIEAGEYSGRLDAMLLEIAEYLERELELRRMISRETFYAKILVGAALLIPLGARCIIAWLTKSVTAAILVFFTTIFWYFVIAGLPLIALYVVYRKMSDTESGKNTIDGFKLTIPGLAGIVQGLSLARFARAFAALYGAGVSMVRALPMAADVCGNRHLGRQLRSAEPLVKTGVPLSEALARTRLTGTLMVRLLQTGEETGNVDSMLSKAADHYESEAHTRIQRAAVMIVPAVIIIMGIIVGVMIIRFYTVDLYGGI